MALSTTNKRILIFGTFFILFTVIVGVVFRFGSSGGEESSNQEKYITGYKVEGSGSNRALKNKKAGFSLLIPENWTVEDNDYKINLLSNDNNCMVNVKIVEYKEEGEELTDFSSLTEVDFSNESINIGGRVFSVTTFKKDGKTAFILAQTRNGNNIYSVDSGLIFSENCVESFNNTLNTVKID